MLTTYNSSLTWLATCRRLPPPLGLRESRPAKMPHPIALTLTLTL